MDKHKRRRGDIGLSQEEIRRWEPWIWHYGTVKLAD